MFKNKVQKDEFEYHEDVRDFTGLIFHCPECDAVFHLHIAEVKVINPKKLLKEKLKGFIRAAVTES